MRPSILCAALCLLSLPAQADTLPQASLFFTPEEVRAIEKPMEKNTAAAAQPVPMRDVSLGAVLYYGPGDWVLWLQGERWTPATQHADIHVLEVDADEVRLKLTPSPDVAAREVVLKPYQIYQWSADKVVEGSPPPDDEASK